MAETVYSKVMKISKGRAFENTWEHQLWLAYMIGREEATKEVSDRYKNWIGRMREKAEKSRYRKFINDIIDNDESCSFDRRDYIYFPDYAQDVSAELADDEYIPPEAAGQLTDQQKEMIYREVKRSCATEDCRMQIDELLGEGYSDNVPQEKIDEIVDNYLDDHDSSIAENDLWAAEITKILEEA